MAKKTKVYANFTTVTTFSKVVALWLFILLPFVGFWLGMKFQSHLSGLSCLFGNY